MIRLIAFMLALVAIPAAAQSPVTVTGPITVGNCAQFASVTIIKDAGVTCSGGGGGGGIVVGTTTVTGGGVTNGQYLFNNAGVVGAATLGTMSTQNASAVAITGGTITGLGLPSIAADAANKQYVDNSIVGLIIHSQALLATTTALPANTYNNGTSGVGATLTGNSNGALTIDSVLTTTSARIVVKNEVAPANNGIYVVTTVGDGSNPYVLTRATDANTPGTANPAEIGFGTYVFVTSGTVNADTGWSVNSTVTTIGTSAINWAQFSVSAGVGAVSSVTNSDGSLTISPTFGNVVGSINTAHSNIWTAAQTITGNGTLLNLNTPSTGQQAFQIFDSASAQKWLMGKQTDDSFVLFDTVGNRFDMTAASNGNMALMPGGGAITAGTPTGGAQGAGTINAQGLYVNGVAVGSGQNGLPFIEAFGGVGDGTTDNTSAFNAAIAAAAYTGRLGVQFGPGVFKFASSLSVTIPSSPVDSTLSLLGSGSGVTSLLFTTGNGLTVTYNGEGNTVHIRNLTLNTQGGGTANGVHLIANFSQSGYVGDDFSNDFYDVVFNSLGGTDYWSTAILSDGILQVNLNGVVISGTGSNQGSGVIVEPGSVGGSIPYVYNFIGCSFNGLGVGINLHDGPQGINIVSSNFTTGGNTYGVLVDGNTAGLDQLFISSSQFNMVNAIVFNATQPASVVTISSNYFIISNNGNGIFATGGTSIDGFSIYGNYFQGSGGSSNTNGIIISSPSTGGIITANIFANLVTGIWLQASSSAVTVQGNRYTGNSQNFLNSAGGANSVGVATP